MIVTRFKPILSVAILVTLALGFSACQMTDSSARAMSPTDRLLKMVDENAVPELLDGELRENVNRIASNGRTPLYYALTKNKTRLQTIRNLVNNSANPFERVPSANSYPIRQALVHHDLKTFSVLACSGYDINTIFQSIDQSNTVYHSYPTILFDAVVQNDVKKVGVILKCGGKTELRNRHGQTPVLVISRNGYKVLMLLLDAGADPAVRDKNGIGLCDRIKDLPEYSDKWTRASLLQRIRSKGALC